MNASVEWHLYAECTYLIISFADSPASHELHIILIYYWWNSEEILTFELSFIESIWFRASCSSIIYYSRIRRNIITISWTYAKYFNSHSLRCKNSHESAKNGWHYANSRHFSSAMNISITSGVIIITCEGSMERITKMESQEILKILTACLTNSIFAQFVMRGNGYSTNIFRCHYQFVFYVQMKKFESINWN